jgi:hypothetical protein
MQPIHTLKFHALVIILVTIYLGSRAQFSTLTLTIEIHRYQMGSVSGE